MRNGNGVSIEHIGDTHLSTPTTSFLLRNVLHVPLVNKNLLFVHRFTLDTNTYIEFHPWHFLVKEQGSRKVLLQDLNDNGLYKLPPSVQLHSLGQSSPPSSHSVKSRSSSFSSRSGCVPPLPSNSVSAFVGERTSSVNWHSRLGHPTLRLCSRVLQNLIYLFSRVLTLCLVLLVLCQKASNYLVIKHKFFQICT